MGELGGLCCWWAPYRRRSRRASEGLAQVLWRKAQGASRQRQEPAEHGRGVRWAPDVPSRLGVLRKIEQRPAQVIDRIRDDAVDLRGLEVGQSIPVR